MPQPRQQSRQQGSRVTGRIVINEAGHDNGNTASIVKCEATGTTHPGDRLAGLCGSGCVSTCTWPCVTFGKVAYRLDRIRHGGNPVSLEGYSACNESCVGCGIVSAIFPFGLWCIPLGLQAAEIRYLYHIKGSALGDGCKALLCPLCTLAQSDREIRLQAELHPPIELMSPLVSVDPAPGNSDINEPQPQSSTAVHGKQPKAVEPMHYPEPLPERGSVSDCDAVHEDAGAADSERSCSKTKDEKVSREQSCKASGTSAMSRKCETHETTDQPSWFKNMFAWGWPTAKEGPRMTKQESAGPAHTWPRTHTEGGINAAKVPVIAVVPADASASTAVVADMSTQTGGQSPPRRDKGDSSRRSSTGNDGGESESAPAQSNASHSPGPDVTLARRQLRVPSDGKDEENMISDKGGAKESNSEGKSTEGHATNAEGQPSSTMVEGANVCEEDKSTASTGPQNVEVRHITASQELQGTSSVTKEPVADKSTPQAPHENEALKNSFRRPEAHHLSTDPLVPSPVRPTEHRMSADHNKFSPDGEDLSQTEQDHPEGNKDMLVSAAITHDPHVPSPKPPQSHRLSTGDPLVPPAGDLLGPGAGERHSLQRDPMVPLDSLWFRPDAPPAPLTHQSDGGDAGGNDGSAGAEVRVEEGTRSLPRKKGRNRDRKGGKGGDGVSGVNRAFTLRGRPY